MSRIGRPVWASENSLTVVDYLDPALEELDLSPFMVAALEEAERAGRRGEMPIGAVVVIDSQIVSRSGPSARQDRSQIRHAELNALLEGGEPLWRDFSRAMLFTTVEPCPLCLGAAVMADVPHIVFGLHDRNVLSSLTVESHPYVRRHLRSYFGGFMAEQSAAILSKYDPRSLRYIRTGSL